MYLKRYTIGSVIYMLLIALLVMANGGIDKEISVELFKLHIPAVPLLAVILAPVVIFYLISISHMMYYSLKSFFKLRSYQKDYEMLVEMIMDELLNKNHHYSFKTEPYQLLAKVLENTSMTVDDKIELTKNEKVDNILKLLSDVKSGQTVDLKKFNLDADNPLVKQNQKNSMSNADLSVESILGKKDKYSSDILEKAFLEYSQTASVQTLKRHEECINKESLFVILSRINSGQNGFEISNEELLSFISKLELNSDDYLSISKELSTHMLPEQRMKLFETLGDVDEKAQEAYLYTLLDLEMIEQAKEFLDSVGKEDMLKFRAYLTLKEAGHNYSINLFI